MNEAHMSAIRGPAFHSPILRRSHSIPLHGSSSHWTLAWLDFFLASKSLSKLQDVQIFTRELHIVMDLWLPCLLPQCVTLKASPPTTSCLGVCFRVTSRACLREAKDGWRQDMVQSETDNRGLHMPWRVPGVAGGSLGFGITR